ncbi:predicted protein [Plenodomus lingam JN3]|uniref:Predicted protein n=1 Tax=Leptosphaeria maculans (strain JN3 / isolate v23.1.3 / race Av1-4-5-6-7-8) TaxID=985895 RepID=E4ZM89_LEPMJ|nr:predicted protein [Plenodomus lingam JN3]CBX92438.1 predicted protein [Plenodomus lingam JN3]
MSRRLDLECWKIGWTDNSPLGLASTLGQAAFKARIMNGAGGSKITIPESTVPTPP